MPRRADRSSDSRRRSRGRDRPAKRCAAVEEEVLRALVERPISALLGASRPASWPSYSAWYDWMAADERDASLGRLEPSRSLAQRYARAAAQRAHTLAEEVIEIADGRSPARTILPDGSEVNLPAIDDSSRVQRDRLRVDARRWYAGKLSGEYADRLKVDHGVQAGTFAELARLAEQED